MGRKAGAFKSRSGRTISVAIYGDSVDNGSLQFSVPPVVLSMAAGQHKFCGFKSTTATINILTDTPLIDLYASTPRDVKVEIHEDGSPIFYGYVTPFAFDQAYTGKGDAVTISAVDLLTARKDIKYANIGNTHGVDLSGLSIVQEICKRSNISRIVQHLNFNDSNDVMKNASPLDVMVAQAGFLQDEVSDVDALSAICMFFGYTAHVVGTTLYLYDENCLNEITDANVYAWSYAKGWTLVQHYYESQESPLSSQTIAEGDLHNDISVSVERAYDAVRITPDGSGKSILMPDVCKEENIEEYDGVLGSYDRVLQDYNSKSGVDYIHYRHPVQSKIMELGILKDGEITDAWDMSTDPVDSNSWNNGAMMLHIDHCKRSRFSIENKDYIIPTSSQGTYMWIRPSRDDVYDPPIKCVGRQLEDTRFSHTGGLVKLNLDFFFTSDGTISNIDSKYTQEYGTAAFLIIRCGDDAFYMDPMPPTVDVWGPDEWSIFYCKDGRLLPTGLAISRKVNDVILQLPNDGQVSVEIAWKYGAYNMRSMYNIYITSLSLEAWGDEIDTECPALFHSFAGMSDDVLSVSSMLTTRNAYYSMGIVPAGANTRPGVVTGVDGGAAKTWLGGYEKKESSYMPICGILMEQLKSRYGQPHAAYKMTVDKNIHPFTAVEWNGQVYTVEAYDRDLYDDTTTITID